MLHRAASHYRTTPLSSETTAEIASVNILPEAEGNDLQGLRQRKTANVKRADWRGIRTVDSTSVSADQQIAVSSLNELQVGCRSVKINCFHSENSVIQQGYADYTIPGLQGIPNVSKIPETATLQCR